MANRYWVGGTANWDGTAGTKWATTSGGAGGASVPTSSDDVYFDGASGAVTVTVTSTANVLSLNFTGFTGTLAGSSSINIFSGGVNLGSTATFTNTGSLVASATATWTSNGKQWAGNYSSSIVTTVTFADNWDFAGNFSQIATLTIGGTITITVRGNLSINALGASSAITFILAGTGTWSVTADASQVDYTINTSGIITLSGTLLFSGSNKIFTYTAGTMVTTGSTLSFSGSGTIDLDGISLNNVNITGTGTYTLLGDLDVNGSSVLGSLGQTITINGAFNITIAGNLTISGTTSIVTGTSSLILDGTGVFSSTQTTGSLRMNLTINTSGTITVSGTIQYRTGTITYTTGTVITTSSTLELQTTATMNTSGMTWNNINISSSGTLTLNSLLSISGTMSLPNANVTFSGTHGWTVGTLSVATALTAQRTYTLVSTKTYSITSNFVVTASTNTFRAVFNSSVGGSMAILTLDPLATQTVGYTNATDIDSSLGQTVWSFQAVISNTLNWNYLSASGVGSSGGAYTFHT